MLQRRICSTRTPDGPVVDDLMRGGRWQRGDPEILIVSDVGSDALRMSCLLHGLPVEELGRMRSDRIMRSPVPTQ